MTCAWIATVETSADDTGRRNAREANSRNTFSADDRGSPGAIAYIGARRPESAFRAGSTGLTGRSPKRRPTLGGGQPSTSGPSTSTHSMAIPRPG